MYQRHWFSFQTTPLSFPKSNKDCTSQIHWYTCRCGYVSPTEILPPVFPAPAHYPILLTDLPKLQSCSNSSNRGEGRSTTAFSPDTPLAEQLCHMAALKLIKSLIVKRIMGKSWRAVQTIGWALSLLQGPLIVFQPTIYIQGFMQKWGQTAYHQEACTETVDLIKLCKYATIIECNKEEQPVTNN